MKRILVVATRQIGDVLLTTPLIRAAGQQWPQARVDVLGFAGTLGMLKGNTDIGELIEVPPRLGCMGTVALARRLWRRYDLALVTQPGDRAHVMGWVAARQRSGLVPAQGGSNWWKEKLLNHVVRSAGDLGDTHVVVEKLQLLQPWRALDKADAQVVPPPPAALPPDIHTQLEPGAVVLHVPSMWDYKQWPLEHYRDVAGALLARGRQVVLTGSAGSRDQTCIAAVRDVGKPPRLLDTSGRLNFNQLVTLFNRCSLYIGPDTSVSHLAAASGLRTIAIFGPTNPLRWRPWPAEFESKAQPQRAALIQHNGNVSVLQSNLACVPCGRAGCADHRESKSDCLGAIAPQRVLKEVWRVLGG